MADYDSIAATGRSIVRLLDHAFEETNPHPLGTTTKAILIRTEDFKTLSSTGAVEDGVGLRPPAISVFLYRVDVNRATRAAWSAVASRDGRARLPLDLHFLLTPWAENAEYELRILGRAMECLEQMPILTGPSLDPSPSWGPGDSIQLTIAELSTEEVMRTFDSLPVDFKLSVPYLARVVRIDASTARPRPEAVNLRVGVRPSTSSVDPPVAAYTYPEDDA
jgi:hypothetical protein